jgi:hypothetical protein
VSFRPLILTPWNLINFSPPGYRTPSCQWIWFL